MSNNLICEWCGQPIYPDEVKINAMCCIKQKDNFYEFCITVCSPCYGLINCNEKDLQDRIKFPDNSQVVLYKVKKYSFPSLKKDKKLEEWMLFSPLRKRGKKADYS